MAFSGFEGGGWIAGVRTINLCITKNSLKYSQSFIEIPLQFRKLRGQPKYSIREPNATRGLFGHHLWLTRSAIAFSKDVTARWQDGWQTVMEDMKPGRE